MKLKPCCVSLPSNMQYRFRCFVDVLSSTEKHMSMFFGGNQFHKWNLDSLLIRPPIRVSYFVFQSAGLFMSVVTSASGCCLKVNPLLDVINLESTTTANVFRWGYFCMWSRDMVSNVGIETDIKNRALRQHNIETKSRSFLFSCLYQF